MKEPISRWKAILTALAVSWREAVDGLGYFSGTIMWGLVWFIVWKTPKPAESKIAAGLSG